MPTPPDARPVARRRRRALGALVACAIAGIALFPGVGHATIEEQRARLPPPATCTDGVEGVWLSHTYNPSYNDWYMFTLRIRRKAPGSKELVGEIESHSWNGSEQDTEPPACRLGLEHWTVFMPAEGTEVNGLVHFWGTSWRVKDAFCGTAPTLGTYNLDHFSGQIDPLIQEFQSVNNDGGRSVNDPTVFRRIGCLEPPPVPHVQVAPPPFYPSTRTGGCSL